MAFITLAGGKLLLLNYMLNKVDPTDMRLHLYTNDITPSDEDVLADYTESTATGYAYIDLTGASWTITEVAGVAYCTNSQRPSAEGRMVPL